MAVVRVLLLTMCGGFLVTAQSSSVDKGAKSKVKSDVCEYDIDLKKNTFHAKCQGQPLGVSVFANSASINSGQVHSVSHHSQGGQGMGAGGEMDPSSSYHPPVLVAMDNRTVVQLKTMKDKLGNQKAAISNISHLLSRGDNDLRSDLAALRGLSPGDSAVRESIIATMRNQYNFMRTAILAHNAELSQVLELLETLVTMTTETRHQAMSTQHRLQQEMMIVNRTMLAMRTTFFPCLKKCQHRRKDSRKKSQCPVVLSAIGAGQTIKTTIKDGVVMKDSSAENSEKIWVMRVDESRDQLQEFRHPHELQFNIITRTISLPFFCEGTGHVVYKNSLICHKADSRTITRYSLRRLEVSAELELPSAGVGNTFPYQFGMKSDIDLAVDEQGLWVIYSTKESAGKMVISKLHPRNLMIEKTWLTSFPKKMAGNAFMVCGVLYATNSFSDVPTFIRYTYNTHTQAETKLEPGTVVFNNALNFAEPKRARSIMLQYSASEHMLYSWNDGEIQTFPVYFKKR